VAELLLAELAIVVAVLLEKQIPKLFLIVVFTGDLGVQNLDCLLEFANVFVVLDAGERFVLGDIVDFEVVVCFVENPRVVERLLHILALLFVFAEQMFDEVFEVVGTVLEFIAERDFLVLDFVREFIHPVAVEGEFACNHGVEDDAQTKHVKLEVLWQVVEDLRGHLVGGAHETRGLVPYLLAKPEIHYFDFVD